METIKRKEWHKPKVIYIQNINQTLALGNIGNDASYSAS